MAGNISTVISLFPYTFAKVSDRVLKDSPYFRLTYQDIEVKLALTRFQELALACPKIPALTSRQITLLEWMPWTLAACVILEKYLPSEAMRDAVQYAHDRIGTLTYIVSLVSAIALIYFGQVAVGSLTLAFIGIGELRERGYIPNKIWNVIAYGEIGFCLFLSSWSIRIMTVISCIANHFLLKAAIKPNPQPYVPTDITAIPHADLMQHVRVKEDHFFYPAPSENSPAMRDRILLRLREQLRQDMSGVQAKIKNEMPAAAQEFMNTMVLEGMEVMLGLVPPKEEINFSYVAGRYMRWLVLMTQYIVPNILKWAQEVLNDEEMNTWCLSKNILERTAETDLLFLIESGILEYVP